jgi:hypothetical protein
MCTKFCLKELNVAGCWWKDDIKVNCKGMMGEFGMFIC